MSIYTFTFTYTFIIVYIYIHALSYIPLQHRTVLNCISILEHSWSPRAKSVLVTVCLSPGQVGRQVACGILTSLVIKFLPVYYIQYPNKFNILKQTIDSVISINRHRPSLVSRPRNRISSSMLTVVRIMVTLLAPISSTFLKSLSSVIGSRTTGLSSSFFSWSCFRRTVLTFFLNIPRFQWSRMSGCISICLRPKRTRSCMVFSPGMTHMLVSPCTFIGDIYGSPIFQMGSQP